MEHYLRADTGTPFCPGCGHGVLMGAVLRALGTLEVSKDKLLFVSGIGCAAWIPSPHFRTDTLHTLHGRAVPFATGAKLANPELTVVVISGDGDLAAIGGNHLIHGARRDTDITVICADNQIFGMTGGQAAPTTPRGVRARSAPKGTRERPFDLVELMVAAGAAYVARYPVTRPVDLVRVLGTAIRTPGFSFVDVLSPCPSQYGRENDLLEPSRLFEATDALCITEAEAAAMSREERQRRLVIGEFFRES
jgi:2-oxoglutarate/2-oxoacid ferredoxin oxidoreductase subunit beta